jgi:hypothetical protein
VMLPQLHLAGIVTFAFFGVFAVAIAYEVLRSATTGHTDVMPPPVTPGIVALWITVGAGYVVRGITGLALAVDVVDHPALTGAAVVTLWAYGIAFVTSRWAVEATAFASAVDGRVLWIARARQAREHLLALARWLPSRVEPSLPLEDWAPLAGRTPGQAPWNVAMVFAGIAAGLTGRLLCGPCSLIQGLEFATLGGLLTVAAIVSTRWRAGAVVAGATVLVVCLVMVDAPLPVLGALPWTLVLGAYLFFSTRTSRKLARPSPTVRVVAACTTPMARLIVGEVTWKAMRARIDGDATVEGDRV